MSFNKKEEQLINNLLSTNHQVVINTLEEVKSTGSSKLLPFLIDLLHASTNDDIKTMTYKILAELKQTDAIPVLVEAIRNEKYFQEQEILIRSCWENGLDYTPYLSVFIDLVIHGDYMTSFEAFTVIENLEGTIGEEENEKLVMLLQNSLADSSPEKQALLEELIQIVPRLK
ncbi:MAG TPA: HEAT repeat domain-containing protein [Prolixibacteraceae bacterium]|nr:HEAT repeat domain-containing protein [Prolixibacteraceae bacterium]HPS12034.1 HEAT repeat domain-containing protein [Prolixibacteraceae bacterium]